MTETLTRRATNRRIFLRRCVMGAAIACLFFGASSLSSALSGVPVRPRAHSTKLSHLPPIPRQRARRLTNGLVQSSLEMKENVDFLLSPAILVQEALSSDIIQTYPAE